MINQTDRNSIIELYIAFFNRVPEANGLSYWADKFEQGMTMPQMADAFYQAAVSYADLTGFSSLMTSGEFVRAIYANTLGRYGTKAPSKTEVDYWSVQIDNQTTTRSDLIKTMLAQAKAYKGDPTWGYVADMIEAKTNAGVEHAVTLAMNYTSAQDAIVRGKQFLTNYTQPVGDWYESSTTLYGNTTPKGSVVVDLLKDTLTDNASAATLAQGSLFKVKDIDLSQLKAVVASKSTTTTTTTTTTTATSSTATSSTTVSPVTIIGDHNDNLIIASALGNEITGNGGNDDITLGAGVDTIIFSETPSSNGVDVIRKFELGKDFLNFANLLNATQESANFITAAVTETAAKTWQNGDVLVLQGYAIDSAAKVASYFGTGKAFANPTNSAKAIVITADVAGDARVWFLLNQTNLTSIEAAEIVQLATLTNINNLLVQNTLASLKASTLVYKPAGVLSYSQTTLLESSSNNGSITDSVTITLAGDSFVGNIGASIGTVSNLPDGLTAKLVKIAADQAKLTISGVAKAHLNADSISNLTIEFKAANFTSGVAPENALKDNLGVVFFDAMAYESAGTLTLSSALPAALVIDLTNDTYTSGGVAANLISGSMANVTTVNMTSVTSAKTISILGSSAAETFYTAPFAGSYQGKGGNDTYYLNNSAVDTIVFDADPINNGIDMIYNFKVGSLGDILDFSAFLNKPGKANLTAQVATDTTPLTWANGDILTVQGYNIKTSSDIAALFGAGKVYAAPTAQAKAVLIVSDLVGDATVWAITNQDTAAITSIEAAEIKQIATLVGVNNILLNGFISTNFV